MVVFNRRQRTEDLLPKPVIDELLPDLPGAETGLLPVASTGGDLKVWFSVPPLAEPSKGETARLFVDNQANPIDEREWNAPIDDADKFLVLPSNWLRNNDWEHRLYYQYIVFNGADPYSKELVMTLDTETPVLATDSKLIFPSEVLPPNKLTAHYLEQHNDEVKAELPAYTTPRPWDRITWYWGETPGNENEGGVKELDDKSFEEPIVVTIKGSLIRERGDGMRYVWYTVADRAGNESRDSAVVELDVAATPIPRKLPWPSVENASGSNVEQTLDPLFDVTGAVVEVPEGADVYPGELIRVKWGVPGTWGAVEVDEPISEGQRRYQIKMESLAAQIGRTLSVTYSVIDDKGVEHPSDPRRLKVLTLPSNRLEAVRCEGLSGGDLSFKNVPEEGARLTLKSWPLMTTDHWVMITMTGVDKQTGQDSVFNAVARRAVTEQEIIVGIGMETEIRVPKEFLNTLMRYEPLSGRVYTSFDGGQTWPPMPAPNFPILDL
ncbi:hypothetical protein, partial [Pseudomonas sp. C32]|uniref:hypothetical protein n=1 Tax=Pseudomonas sp. C32 TaxID=1529208 RepID=UPI00260484A1